jgi:hypothetical protein
MYLGAIQAAATHHPCLCASLLGFSVHRVVLIIVQHDLSCCIGREIEWHFCRSVCVTTNIQLRVMYVYCVVCVASATVSSVRVSSCNHSD